MAIQDYRRDHHGLSPKRLTVCYEVARELDAELVAMADNVGLPPQQDQMCLLTEGGHVTLLGVSVVADLPEDEIVDIRR